MNAYEYRLALMSILERIRPLEGCGNNQVEGVARKLEMLIVESRLEPGTLLGTKKGLRGRVKVSPGTLNEALLSLASRGIVMMKRGVKGGIFVAAPSLEVALRDSLLEVGRGATLVVKEGWAVLKQFEPLVVIEAIRARTEDTVNELKKLASRRARSTGMALRRGQP